MIPLSPSLKTHIFFQHHRGNILSGWNDLFILLEIVQFIGGTIYGIILVLQVLENLFLKHANKPPLQPI